MYTCWLSKNLEGAHKRSNPIPIFTFSSSKSPQNVTNCQEFKDPPTNISSTHAEKQKWWMCVQKIGTLRAVGQGSDENCGKRKWLMLNWRKAQKSRTPKALIVELFKGVCGERIEHSFKWGIQKLKLFFYGKRFASSLAEEYLAGTHIQTHTHFFFFFDHLGLHGQLRAQMRMIRSTSQDFIPSLSWWQYD